MATILSQFTKNTLPTVSGDCAGDVIVQKYFVDLTAAQLLLNNVVDIGILPAGHSVVNMKIVPDDLDTNGTPLIALDVGIMSGTPGDSTSVRTCGAEYFAADIGARTGVISTMSLPSGFKVLATGADRSIGVKIQAAPATAAAGRIRLLVEMAPDDTNVQF